MRTKKVECSISVLNDDGTKTQFFKRIIFINAHWFQQVKEELILQIGPALNDFDVSGIIVQRSSQTQPPGSTVEEEK